MITVQVKLVDNWKTWVDIGAVSSWWVSIITGLINMVPPLVAFLTSIFTLLWVVFRVWEMKTTQSIWKRVRQWSL